jgi:hypothetical protein
MGGALFVDGQCMANAISCFNYFLWAIFLYDLASAALSAENPRGFWLIQPINRCRFPEFFKQSNIVWFVENAIRSIGIARLTNGLRDS